VSDEGSVKRGGELGIGEGGEGVMGRGRKEGV